MIRTMKTFSVMELFCSPGDVVLDVGANIGAISRKASRIVGTEGAVFAFEPLPLLWPKFTKYVSGCENVELIPVALSDKTGIEYLRSHDDHLAGGSLASTGLRPDNWHDIEVTTERLDNFCQSRAIIPNFLKIDVEGAEDKVLRGGRSTIERYRPPMILEIHTGRWLAAPYYLEWLGYSLYLIHMNICLGVSWKTDSRLEVTKVMNITAEQLHLSRIKGGPMVLDYLAIPYDNRRIRCLLSDQSGYEHLMKCFDLVKSNN